MEPGHAGGDTFLTGAVLNATSGYDYKNSISLDQVAAGHFAPFTRFPSLELSRDGGTGSARATHTMSFSREGVPLSTENRPRLVFERLFLEGSASSRAAARRRIQDDQSILDIIQDDVQSLNRRLGPTDRRKVDEYLSSVRAVEKQVRRAEEWMNVPRPNVDATTMRLEVNPGSPDDLRDYLRTMFDLIFLAFQTDTTRVCTFQMHREVTNQQFNALLGFPDRYHGLSHHGGDREALDKLARIDRFHIEQLAYFLAKLKAAREGDGSLLDRTLILYGSGMNNGDTGGHYATNIPILFAGGHGLGVRQGQHLAYRQSRDDRSVPPLRPWPICFAPCSGIWGFGSHPLLAAPEKSRTCPRSHLHLLGKITSRLRRWLPCAASGLRLQPTAMCRGSRTLTRAFATPWVLIGGACVGFNALNILRSARPEHADAWPA